MRRRPAGSRSPCGAKSVARLAAPLRKEPIPDGFRRLVRSAPCVGAFSARAPLRSCLFFFAFFWHCSLRSTDIFLPGFCNCIFTRTIFLRFFFFCVSWSMNRVPAGPTASARSSTRASGARIAPHRRAPWSRCRDGCIVRSSGTRVEPRSVPAFAALGGPIVASHWRVAFAAKRASAPLSPALSQLAHGAAHAHRPRFRRFAQRLA